MTIAFFSCHAYEPPFLEAANANHRHQLTFLPDRPTPDTAHLTADHQAVCVSVNTRPIRPTLQALARPGIRLVALRCTYMEEGRPPIRYAGAQ